MFSFMTSFTDCSETSFTLLLCEGSKARLHTTLDVPPNLKMVDRQAPSPAHKRLQDFVAQALSPGIYACRKAICRR